MAARIASVRSGGLGVNPYLRNFNGRIEQKAAKITARRRRNHNGILRSQCDDIDLAQRTRRNAEEARLKSETLRYSATSVRNPR
jgi:hypothetical protein